MNWEALGAIGEIVGAVAVVLTLCYLALQIRQNTREVQLNTFQAITERNQQQQSNLACDPELARIYRAGLADPKSLDENERVRFEAYVGIQLRNWEDVFLRHRDGLLDEEVWVAKLVGFRRFLSQTGMRWVWMRRKEQCTRSFRDFIDREIDAVSESERSRTTDS